VARRQTKLIGIILPAFGALLALRRSLGRRLGAFFCLFVVWTKRRPGERTGRSEPNERQESARSQQISGPIFETLSLLAGAESQLLGDHFDGRPASSAPSELLEKVARRKRTGQEVGWLP